MTDEHSVRKILNVFIASPGDVNPEREIAREVVDKVNRIFSQSLSWQIDLKGWEDLSPGTGRPQELINKDVDSCTLFLGILWRRWGSSTGVYSSGFEEEFERARERNKNTGNPTIWLCFKQVDRDFLQDPGQQLIKVREFREAQKNAREFLFQEFKDLEDWKEKLEEWLSKHILELHQSSLQKDNDEIDEQISLPQADQLSLLSISKEQNKLESFDQKQLLYLISRIDKVIKNPEENEALNSFEIARLSLFSKTLLQRRYSDEFLSNHEINLLYLSKNQLNPTNEELFQLLRTIINDRHDLKAAWYWLKNEKTEDIASYLHLIADRDGTIALRKQAIEFLKIAGVCLTSDTSERSEIRTSILTDNSEEIRAAWLSYLGSTGSLEDLNITESASSDDDPSVQAVAKSAKLLILARHKPDEALKDLLNNDFIVSEPIIDEIKKQSISLDKDLLFKALEHSNEKIRKFVLKILINRNLLSQSELQNIMSNGSKSIKEICYDAIINLGDKVNLIELKNNLDLHFSSWIENPSYKAKFNSLLSPEELLSKINNMSDGAIYYKILSTQYFDMISTRIRKDLECEFNTTIKEYELKLREEFKLNFDLKNKLDKSNNLNSELYIKTAKAVAQINTNIKDFKNLFDEYIKYQFISAALAGLIKHGNPEDIVWGRKYLAEVSNICDPRFEAIKLVELYGDDSDVEQLIDIAKNSYGKLFSLAAKAAIKLSPGVNGAASVFLASKKSDLVKIAVQSLENEDKQEVFKVLEPLLEEENRNIHSYSLLYFLKKSSQQELEELLERYTQKPRFYYHVICQIDKILYAPSPYKEMYLRKFKDEINYKFNLE